MSNRATNESSNNPLRDLIGFVLLAVSIFLLLCLVSYNPLDPSFNTVIQGERVVFHNYGGIVGSYTADLLMQLFGYASLLIPFALGGVTYSIVFRPVFVGWIPKSLGVLAMLFSGALLLGLFPTSVDRIPPLGGVTGYYARIWMTGLIGTAGSVLAGMTGLAVALVLVAGLRFQALVRGAEVLADGILHFRKWTGPLAEALSKRVRKLLELGEKELEKGMKEIRSDVEPTLPPIEPIKVAGEAMKRESEPSLDPPEHKVREIPIVVSKTPKPKENTPPKFHSMSEEAEAHEAKAKRENRVYKLPDITLLDAPEEQSLSIDRDELFQNAQTLERKLKDFGVFGKVVEVQPGPVVTMYEFEPAPGVKVNTITRLNDDLALALKALSVRITPIPGKAVIGIEVANRNRQTVYLKDIISNEIFSNSASPITMALGKEISGTPYTTDLRKMPHLLVAGATGSGKSVSVNSMIVSVLYKARPDEVRMILVDPKMLELSLYDGIPHLLLPVVTDPRKAAAALRWAVLEMERRYRLMADIGVRNIEGYNKKIPKHLEEKGALEEHKKTESELPLEESSGAEPKKSEEHSGPIPYLMIVIDELADLMMVSSHEVEESIIRLAQMARAAGIHLLLATQRPSVDVITGVIKANMPARISFQVSSKIDSRTILDSNGAELLLGAGDMLYLPPGTSRLHRIHGAFVTDSEVKKVTDFWKEQGTPDYDHEILKVREEEAELAAEGGGEDEEMYQQALEVVKAHRVASISMIQRKLRIGYNRAARIVERMEEEGLLAPGEVGKPREVRMSLLDG